MTAWFQVLAGENADIIANAKKYIKINSPSSLFHLAHAYLVMSRIDEATKYYGQGLSKATRHDICRLDEELDLLSWHFPVKTNCSLPQGWL